MQVKRLLCLMLAVLMFIGILAGCGSKTENTNSSNNAVDEGQNTENQNTGTESEGNDEDLATLPSWKRDTTPITVDWFVAYDWYGKVFDPENNLADKALLEETGITLNILTGDGEKLSVLIATEELPDIVTCDAVATQRLQMENAGMVLDLEELSEKYAPDLNVPQSQRDWYRNEDGKWYSLISYFYATERTNEEFGGFYVTHNSNFVRTDILEQIGMTMDDLRTKEGFYQALKAVKDKGIKYNGMDVIPLTGVYPDHMAEQFGVQLEDEEGNLLDIRLQPEYLEALKYYNRMFNDGLITTDEFTQDQNQRDQKVASGQVFIAQGWMTVKDPRRTLYSSDPNAKILYCGVVEGGDSGKPAYRRSVNSAGWTTTMITKAAEHPDRIITLFAYLSQESVTLDYEFGYGCYDIVDGKVVRHPDKVKEYEEDFTAAYNKYNSDLPFAVDYTINQKYENLDVDDELEKDRIAMERDEAALIYDDKCFTDVDPQAGTDLAAVKAAIDEFWSSEYPRMITAANEQECEDLYNKAIEQIKAMGYDELYEYQNQRFKENKAKLGIEHAWPTLQK